MAASPPLSRIAAIEGLRGFLALWVLADHVLAVSGYAVADLAGPLWLLRQGWYAVDVFIVISGFVIFYLLDHKSETYAAFITRRFFRLWPLFAVLFSVSLLTSLIQYSNATEMLSIYPASNGLVESMARIESWWRNMGWHILAHVPMAHGAIPDQVLPEASSAFLGQAWSISLEWQFYLIAPIVFALCRSWLGAVLVTLAALWLYVLAPGLPTVTHGSFLPMHVQYFYVGGLLYFLYRRGWFVIPRIWPLVHPAALFLGRISYSIYLGHFMVINACQAFLLAMLPGLDRWMHAALLGLLCVPATVGFSALSYRWIERPGNRAGYRLALALNNRHQVRRGGAVVSKV